MEEHPELFEALPFYATWSLALMGCGLGIHRVRVGVLKRIQRLEQQHAVAKERARIAHEMHDDMGAGLTQISLLAELARRGLPPDSPSAAHLRKLADTTTELFRRIDEIVWAANPEHDSLVRLVDYVSRYSEQFLRVAEIRCRFDFPEIIPNCTLTSEERHNLFLAVKEALNNIVKHAHATEVWIRLTCAERRFVLRLEDNGRGFQPNESASTRHGIRSMRRRLESIGGSLDIRTAPGAGSCVELRFQLEDRRD